MTSPTRRKEMDIMKLMMSDYDVLLGDTDKSQQEFFVKFLGPPDSPYEGGQWKLRVVLPENYPYKSPSIGFTNRIYHPNVDEVSGSVCLDVINQTWSPMFELKNVFETFLPQLLLYPNPTDPLNPQAAELMIRNPDKYNEKVREHTKTHASTPIVGFPSKDEDCSMSDDLSDMASDKAFSEAEDDCVANMEL